MLFRSQAGALAQLGLMIPWLSWLQDTGLRQEESGETRCRVYGHRLEESAPEVSGPGASDGYAWLSARELTDALADGLLLEGEDVMTWLHMWQSEEDEDGNAVTRSFGVPSTHVQYFRFNGNGNEPGTYRVGEFDAEGKPKQDAVKAA